MDPTAPRFVYVTVDRKPIRDGIIEVIEGRPLRPRLKARTVFKAIPGNKAKPASHRLASESDARRWLDECEIGGNLNGFLHELNGRRFRR